MRVGMVCPYAWDVPGGVGAHVRDLAETLIEMGHDVSVLTPTEDASNLQPYVVNAGKAVSLPSNGSVARVAFGPSTARITRRWLREGGFDVIHVHEPEFPSPAMYAVLAADVPVVATFHTFGTRNAVLYRARGALAPIMERIHARIAVSPYARRFQVEHLSHGAVEIPNGVRVSQFARAQRRAEWSTPGTIGFLGRIDEPRKGLPVLLEAFRTLGPLDPAAHLVVAGPGNIAEVRKTIPEALRDRVEFLGLVSEQEKAELLRSVVVYCAPNTGGESFGIILTEAMSAGAPVVASDLDSFRRVLDDGRAGVLFRNEDATDLANALRRTLDDPQRAREMAEQAGQWVLQYDWRNVAAQVVAVYETVLGATPVAVGGTRAP
jgi:phosphatidylinositol alpha-mannosyltransferase